MIVFNMSITVMILACGFFTPWREMGWPNFLESALGLVIDATGLLLEIFAR
jgi:hypothetical protein